MAYIKTDWQDGDVITEAGLDHLETGVYNNSVAIGDLSELDTTAKANLVAAINEAAQSGGGGGGLSNSVKAALLQLASKVAYIDEDGQDYYDDLYNALYPGAELVSINADYTQSGAVYPTTSLEDLRNDLVVNAIYDNGSVVPVISYTLSGTLEEGTSTITVTYEGFTDTFDVTVSAVPTVSSISAVYTQSGTVYDTDSLDSLKSDLVVTAVYSDSSTEVVPSTDYTLSGTLTVGTSTITVSYEGKTTSFSVTVSAGIHGYLYHFNDSIAPVHNDLDLAITATTPQYDTGIFDKAVKVADQGSGIYTATMGGITSLAGDFTIAFFAKGASATNNQFFCNAYYIGSTNISSKPSASAFTLSDGWTSPDGVLNFSKKFAGLGFVWYSSKIYFRALTKDLTNAFVVHLAKSGFDPTAWHHYAICRKNDVLRLFVDGTEILSITYGYELYVAPFTGFGYGSNESSAQTTPNYSTGVGTTGGSVLYDELLILDSVGLYDSNFTVPAQPYNY